MRRRCPKCGAEWDAKGPIGVREECPECAAFMHTCGNCRHYDAALKGCRLPNTEPSRDAAGVSFCEEFDFGPSAAAPQGGPVARRPEDDARRRFEDLFRDSGKP